MTSRQIFLPSGGHPAPAWQWCQSTRRTIALSAGLVLSIAISGQPSAAQAKQDFLIANIDSTVSPRDDFFQYANGTWLKRNPIPDDAARWGIWSLVSEDIASRLRRISEDAAAKRAPRGSIEQLIGDFWFAGMDSASLNRDGLAPLKPDLDRIGRIRSIRDLIDVVAVFHSRDQVIGRHRVFFFGRVEQDDKNRDRWMYSLVQSGITMNSPDYYSSADPQRAKVRGAFREYLFTTFFRLQRDSAKARASADAVYEMEARLAQAFDQRHGYQMLGLAELSRLAPTIDWNRYLRGIGITSVDSVNMRSPRFYQTLDSLLRPGSLESWKDYLRFWLIKVNAPFLDDLTSNAFADYDRAYTGVVTRRPRWRRVLAQAQNWWVGQPLATKFEEQYFPESAKARHHAVAESLRVAFGQRIERLDWMSDSTKTAALRKLARLKITIGVSDNQVDFSTMPLRRDAYVLNVIRASTWFHDRDMKKLNRPVDRTAGDPRPGLTDAWYDDANNEVTMTPGSVILAPGLRDEDIDDAVVYGTTFLGHEISHAFDSEGRHYDADGNKVDWWTARDAAAFLERAQVMIDQYNEFMPLDGLHVNGQRSLRENMADFVGLRVALDAFKKTEQFRKNESIDGFTPLQRFFLAYAYGRMGHERRESLATRLRGGAYAPDRERVNGVLMNIPEFYQAFDVKPGDRMYVPGSARVKIW